jgi:hypothetical protein
MLINDRRLWITAGFTAVTLAATLTACSGSAGSAVGSGDVQSSLSLTETKSSAQLLRNVAASLLDQTLISSLTSNDDVSVSCGSDDSVRKWHSTVIAGVAFDNEPKLMDIADGLVKGLEGRGWVAAATDTDKGHIVDLTKSGSDTVMQISALPSTHGALRDAHGAQVVIVVDGPCVQTDGPDSAEVKVLEGR